MTNLVPFQPQQTTIKPKSDEQQIIEDLGEDNGRDAVEICDRLSSEPLSLKTIAGEIRGTRDDAGARVFYKWRLRSPALVRLYARACQSRAHVLADQLLDVVDNEPDPHKARVKMDSIKWIAGKLNRADFGDDPQQQVGVSVTVNADQGSSALDVIRERLNRKRQSSQKSMLPNRGEGVVIGRGEGVAVTPEHTPYSSVRESDRND